MLFPQNVRTAHTAQSAMTTNPRKNTQSKRYAAACVNRIVHIRARSSSEISLFVNSSRALRKIPIPGIQHSPSPILRFILRIGFIPYLAFRCRDPKVGQSIHYFFFGSAVLFF